MNADFTYTMIVDQTPEEVFNAINHVRAWWSEDFKGESQKAGETFEVRFEDVHYSRHTVTESIPGKKIAWLVTDSHLSFLQDKTEWNGTSQVFVISRQDNKTHITFTHKGLVPAIECFGDCSKGWTYYLAQSLLPYITTGKANPNVLKDEIRKKQELNA